MKSRINVIFDIIVMVFLAIWLATKYYNNIPVDKTTLILIAALFVAMIVKYALALITRKMNDKNIANK